MGMPRNGLGERKAVGLKYENIKKIQIDNPIFIVSY